MNQEFEINRLKQEVLLLRATVSFQTAAFQSLYTLFLDSVAKGEHGLAYAEFLKKSYGLTLDQQISLLLAKISDDRPDFATELHKIWQECRTRNP